jgi:myo-inositol-1(or 4)-monophosphatase
MDQAPDPVTGPVRPPTGPGPAAEHVELLALAHLLASDAGALLLDGLERTRTSVATKSTVTDMVTEMDRASERLIVDGIVAARPDDGIVGEEGTDRRGTSGVQWIIDPLDGTTNYIYALPGFGVSIGVAATDPSTGTRELVAGVVVDPVHGETFAAVRGGGATRNGDPISCSTEVDLGRALVATGFSYDPARRRHQAEVVAHLMPHIRDIRRLGAAAVDLCAVACGRVDAQFEQGLEPWDYAAGVLIAAEAGVTVGNLDGGPPGRDYTMAAPSALFDALRERLLDAGAQPLAGT